MNPDQAGAVPIGQTAAPFARLALLMHRQELPAVTCPGPACGGQGEAKPWRNTQTGEEGISLCRRCDGAAYIARQDAERELRRDEEHAGRLANLHQVLGEVGLPRPLRLKTFENFDASDNPHALAAAREFVTRTEHHLRAVAAHDWSALDALEGVPSLYLFSERPGEPIAPGTGKTHLAAAVCRELLSLRDVRPAQVRFVSVNRLMLELQDTFGKKDRSELDVIEEYAAPEVLVLDDFGAEKLSDYTGRTLLQLLEDRQGKCNLFTSNCDPFKLRPATDIAEEHARRIGSRIAETFRIVCMGGPDRRLVR